MRTKKDIKVKPLMYKGYNIKALKKEIDHVDYYLVAEYEKEFGEIK